jgi:hypothetical protein
MEENEPVPIESLIVPGDNIVIDDSNLLSIEEEYKRILNLLVYEPHHVNRDGDLFTIICPSCGSRNISRVGGFFICTRHHIFSLYLEDGLRKESDMSEEEKNRILGDDLNPKDGKDAHGHEKYDLFEKDDTIPMYFSLSLWGLENEDRTLGNVKKYLDIFKNRINEFVSKFKNLYIDINNWSTDFDEALIGKSDWRVESSLKPVWMKKAIVIANELNSIDTIFGNEDIYVNLIYIK